MINKKIFILSVLMLIVFSAGSVFAEKNYIKNFVTLLSGATNAVSTSSHAYSFVGQPVVFNTTESKDYVSKSAFGAALRTTQSSNIIFTNKTSAEPFEDTSVYLKVIIESNNSSYIGKVRYRIWEGENADWSNYDLSPEHDYSVVKSTYVVFESTVPFSKGKEMNSFMVYAQLEDGSKRWSDVYTVRISSEISEKVDFISPDSLTGIASLDPLVETTNYSINYTSVTISLYKGRGEGVEGSEIYTVSVSSNTPDDDWQKELYKGGKISYNHSYIAKNYTEKPVPEKLTANMEYTLVLKSSNSEEIITLPFTALDGGVADILTYPSPFNPNKEKIKIRYLLGQKSKVTIRLYDKAGKLVCKLLDRADRDPGTSTEEWDGKNYAGDTLATGAYIVEIIAKADDGKEHRRYTALAIVGK